MLRGIFEGNKKEVASSHFQTLELVEQRGEKIHKGELERKEKKREEKKKDKGDTDHDVFACLPECIDANIYSLQ